MLKLAKNLLQKHFVVLILFHGMFQPCLLIFELFVMLLLVVIIQENFGNSDKFAKWCLNLFIVNWILWKRWSILFVRELVEVPIEEFSFAKHWNLSPDGEFFEIWLIAWDLAQGRNMLKFNPNSIRFLLISWIASWRGQNID